MSAPATVPGLDQAPTAHPRLLDWVREVADLTTPERVVWCDGSDAEWQRLTDQLVESGALVRLNPDKKPNSFWARTDPGDVARVEERTFICSVVFISIIHPPNPMDRPGGPYGHLRPQPRPQPVVVAPRG